MRRAGWFALHVCRLPVYLVAGFGLAAWEWWDQWRRELRWL
jgi:hypothetical protein